MKSVGGSMIKGNRRLHILVNKEVVKLWANGPFVAKSSDSPRKARNTVRKIQVFK